MGDVDFLIKREDVVQAMDVLGRGGFTAEDRLTPGEIPASCASATRGSSIAAPMKVAICTGIL